MANKQQDAKHVFSSFTKIAVWLSSYTALNHSLGFVALKWFACFAGGLYLFGFSLNGVNMYGVIDALIPVERLLCFGVSMFLFIQSVGYFHIVTTEFVRAFKK